MDEPILTHDERKGRQSARGGVEVRISSTFLSGKQITLTDMAPGIWIGDVAIFDSTGACMRAADARRG